MPRLLFVDADEDFRGLVQDMVDALTINTVYASTLSDARSALDEDFFDAMLVNIDLPDGTGTDLMEHVESDETEVIFVTDNASVESAVDALRGGALDYLTKPVDRSRLHKFLKNVKKTRLLKRRVSELSRELRSLGRFDRMVGGSPGMQEVYDLVERVAPTEASVLITGETGTGKEMVARSLHRLSKRNDSPFIAVNCGAVPASLMESELFGHEKGAFTGANRQHRGMFERAHQGTLLLDEITEMNPDLQVKLLRVLETQQVRRVGGDRLIDVDVRIISATNRRPQEAVTEDKLREDLLYRLAVFPIALPPLRERPGDVRMLTQHFLEDLNRKHETEKTLSRTTLQVLETHSWPGNVRELQNTIERAFILAEEELTPGCIRFEGEVGVLAAGQDSPLETDRGAGEAPRSPAALSLEDMERQHILRVLREMDNDKKAAAETLGISLKTLYNRLKKYREAGLEV